MVGRTLDWKEELGRWLKPFLDRSTSTQRAPTAVRLSCKTSRNVTRSEETEEGPRVCLANVLLGGTTWGAFLRGHATCEPSVHQLLAY
jgi:hypothetical protein